MYFCEWEPQLKEHNNIERYGSTFQWKYQFWYAKNICGAIGMTAFIQTRW
ncbi:DUF3737 family protein [Christensenella hongkongensis]